jgi:hypothetical protein
VRFVVITDYKGKKFLGLKAEKTLLGSILGEKLKNTLSCHNKGTYQRQIRAAGSQDLLRNRDLRKTNNLNNIHLVQPKAQDLCLSVVRTRRRRATCDQGKDNADN